MNHAHGAIDRYVVALRGALAREFLFGRRVTAEARDHLADAAERYEQQGFSRPDAEAAAIAAFGSPELVASAMADNRFLALHRAVVVAAVALGAGIAWIDTRPGWDDTGVTAAALVLVAAILGTIAPRRATAWGLLVGAPIPIYAIACAPSWSALTMCIVLLFPVAGAWMGRGARRMLHTASL